MGYLERQGIEGLSIEIIRAGTAGKLANHSEDDVPVTPQHILPSRPLQQDANKYPQTQAPAIGSTRRILLQLSFRTLD